MATPRGIRNNNPCNIRHSKDNWKGKSPKQTDPAFVQFISMEYGYRATFCILRTYINKYGLNTLEKCIGRYAPPNENHTGKYVETVSKMSGVAKNAKLDPKNKEQMCKVVAAMSYVENGIKADMNQIKRGYDII